MGVGLEVWGRYSLYQVYSYLLCLSTAPCLGSMSPPSLGLPPSYTSGNLEQEGEVEEGKVTKSLSY